MLNMLIGWFIDLIIVIEKVQLTEALINFTSLQMAQKRGKEICVYDNFFERQNWIRKKMHMYDSMSNWVYTHTYVYEYAYIHMYTCTQIHSYVVHVFLKCLNLRRKWNDSEINHNCTRVSSGQVVSCRIWWSGPVVRLAISDDFIMKF